MKKILLAAAAFFIVPNFASAHPGIPMERYCALYQYNCQAGCTRYMYGVYERKLCYTCIKRQYDYNGSYLKRLKTCSYTRQKRYETYGYDCKVQPNFATYTGKRCVRWSNQCQKVCAKYDYREASC